MELPRIKYPIYDAEIPSTKKRIKYRPMTVKEEKILLIARESEESSQIITAIAQVVNNCLLDKGHDVAQFAVFDVEYLFLKIRMHSVSDVATVSYKDNEDGEIRDFSIDLNKVEIKFSDLYLETIATPLVIDNVTIKLKSPSISDFETLDLTDTSPDGAFKIIASCLDTVNDTNFNGFPMEMRLEFIEQIPSKEFEKIKVFFDNIPKLHHVIKYTNKNGNERTIVLDSLVDFFTV